MAGYTVIPGSAVAELPTRDVSGAGDFLIFELDGHGTILHFSSHSDQAQDPALRTEPGLNVFEDAGVFGEPEEIRSKFRSFLNSSKAMESFSTGRRGESDRLGSKVTFVKTFETGQNNTSPLVMMEIKSK